VKKGLPDFPWCNLPNWENIYQITTKYTKQRWNTPSGLKNTKTAAIKCAQIGHPRRTKINQNWDFWYANIPSAVGYQVLLFVGF
jgi:hypothetical protein